MDENTFADYKERLCKCESMIEQIREKTQKDEICLTEFGVRLMKVEDTAKLISELVLTVKELAVNQKNQGDNFNEKLDVLTDNIQTIGDKVEAISDEPKKNWSTFKTSLISTIGGVIGTAIIGFLAYMIYASK